MSTRLLLLLLVWLIPVGALAASPLVAVLEFRGDLAPSIRAKLSDDVRAASLDVLRGGGHRLMTRESMAAMLADMGLDPACAEGECEVETGRNIGADLVVSGGVLEIEGLRLLTLKLHDTKSGDLLAVSEVRGESVLGLLDGVAAGTQELWVEGGVAPQAKRPSSAGPTDSPRSSRRVVVGDRSSQRQESREPQGFVEMKDVERVLYDARRKLRYCYTYARQEDPSLEGIMWLTLTLNSDGRVRGAVQEPRSTLKSEPLRECLERQLHGLDMPRPMGGAVSFSYPFEFQPDSGDRSNGGVGKLNVQLNPGWAKLFVDGRYVTTTPVIGHELPVGEHDLRLVNEREGVDCSNSGAMVAAGETTIWQVEAADCQAEPPPGANWDPRLQPQWSGVQPVGVPFRLSIRSEVKLSGVTLYYEVPGRAGRNKRSLADWQAGQWGTDLPSSELVPGEMRLWLVAVPRKRGESTLLMGSSEDPLRLRFR